MPGPKKPIPEFPSEGEERAFRAKQDSTKRLYSDGAAGLNFPEPELRHSAAAEAIATLRSLRENQGRSPVTLVRGIAHFGELKLAQKPVERKP